MKDDLNASDMTNKAEAGDIADRPGSEPFRPIPTERQARELVPLPTAEERCETWWGAVDTHGPNVDPGYLRAIVQTCLILRKDGLLIQQHLDVLRDLRAEGGSQAQMERMAVLTDIFESIRDGKATATFAAYRREHPEVEAEIMRFLSRDEITGC